MNRSTRQFLMASFFTAFLTLVVWYWGQYVACALGALTGALRIYLFWVSREGERFERHEALKLPPVKRTEVQKQELEQEYVSYIEAVKKIEFWRKPKGLFGLVAVAALIVLFDTRMIFYTFFLTMMTSWVWFQGYLAWKVGK